MAPFCPLICLRSEAYCASDVSDSQRDSCNRANELRWTDNLSNDRAWDNHCPDANRCNRDDGIRCSDIVRCCNAHCPRACSHDACVNDHEDFGTAFEGGNEDQDDCSPSDYAESYR